MVSVLVLPVIPAYARWKQNGITVAGGNGQGDASNQLHYPMGLVVDDDQSVFIADRENHRIVEWKPSATSGQVVAGGNGQGNRMDQLNQPSDVILDKEKDSLLICDGGNRRVMQWCLRNRTYGRPIIENINCRGLAMDDQRSMYVSDFRNNEVRRYRDGETNGTVVAGGNGEGDHRNQLNCPTYIFVDQDHSVYVSDCWNHRVMKWVKDAKEGLIVAGGRGMGKGLTQLSHPRGVFVDPLGTVYVAEGGNNRVMRWCKEGTKGDVIVGENGEGTQPNQLNSLVGLSFDRHGNLYVVDVGNNTRVQRFSIALDDDLDLIFKSK